MRRAIGPAALALLLALPLQAQEGVRRRTVAEDLTMFSQVLNHLRLNHPDSLDSHTLIMAAIAGMVRAADPHSYVITSYRLDAEKEKARREGRLVPVPISFIFVGGSPVIVGVVPGSAASAQDILPGDQLIAIDGDPVRAESADELDLALAGDRRRPVALTVERRRGDGSLARLERIVRRERTDELTAVPAAFMLDSETGYLRITAFENTKVADDVRSALGRLERQGMRRLILDLRDNPGGIVEQSARVAGEFLPRGTLLYTQAGRRIEVADTGRVGRSFWSSEKRYPMVVLMNNGSASAAELVAGALQDHDRALIVGRPSFGKSLVMRGFPLADGSVVVLVVGTVRTPCGRVIQREYRDVTTRDYYRLSRAERDTAGRPSCRTAGGRTVYGGGGIVPDVRLREREPAPVWIARLEEASVPLQWVGPHVSENGTAYAGLDQLAAAPALAPGALDGFRTFARREGASVPDGPEADALLERRLLLRVALTKWGPEGYYRLAAVLDPEVVEAIAAFAEASRILSATEP
ncbi:MAG TPA: S41 family peptidase [Gemmatimonadaceae bacterium]|nr:S41 family peptidase [Gemmatimonadaceae bacterium]